MPREKRVQEQPSPEAIFGLRHSSMNKKPFIQPTARFANLPLGLVVAVSTMFFGTSFVYSQAPKKPAGGAGAMSQKPTSSQGYLSKATPPALRFASPPKPPVAYLPPLPITYDPQPVFSSDFAPPTTDLPVAQAPPPPPLQPSVVGPSMTSLVSSFTTNRPPGQIPSAPVDLGSVSPQMLVRFFPGGKHNEVELVLTNAVSFRVPVREEKPSSSASYEVK